MVHRTKIFGNMLALPRCPAVLIVNTVATCKPSCMKTLEPTTLQCLKHQATQPSSNLVGSSRDRHRVKHGPWTQIEEYWSEEHDHRSFFQTSPLAEHQAMNSSAGDRGLIDLLYIHAMLLLVAGETCIYWVYTAIHHGFHSLYIKCDLSHSSAVSCTCLICLQNSADWSPFRTSNWIIPSPFVSMRCSNSSSFSPGEMCHRL